MSYLPFILMNVVIFAMVAHVFMRAVSDRREHVARVESRRRVEHGF